MINYKTVLAGSILLTLSISTSFASPGNSAPYSAKVHVSVSADKNIKRQVESYINGELRSLHDIELVEEGAEFGLDFLAVEPETVGGRKHGVILSVVILHYFDHGRLLSMFQKEYSESGMRATYGLSWFIGHWLRVGSNDQLHSLCRELVADFDSEYLEKN